MPSGFDGSGRSPAARSTVVVVVLTADVGGDDELPPFEQPFTARPTAPAPSPLKNVRRESTALFYTRTVWGWGERAHRGSWLPGWLSLARRAL